MIVRTLISSEDLFLTFCVDCEIDSDGEFIPQDVVYMTLKSSNVGSEDQELFYSDNWEWISETLAPAALQHLETNKWPSDFLTNDENDDFRITYDDGFNLWPYCEEIVEIVETLKSSFQFYAIENEEKMIAEE